MIRISHTASALLLHKDGADITIDHAAIASALPAVLATLLRSDPALAQARREAYEQGLAQGYAQCQIEQATSERIAERQAADLVDALIGCGAMASAA